MASPIFHPPSRRVAIIGGGPAGLMAADVISAAGLAVTIYDRMPSLGRKLLIAGRGGLNLTHSEPFDVFLSRYGRERSWLEPAIRAFPPSALIAFAAELGQETFAGSSGRIFPKAMKASPLLRAWLMRLAGRGVEVRLRHRWTGFVPGGGMSFIDDCDQESVDHADAVVLALGGASWPRLGSDGAWTQILQSAGIVVRPLRPANCGITIAWTNYISERFAGLPLKRIALECGGVRVRGEALVTATGLEGSAVYALSSKIRSTLDADATAVLLIDFRPDMTEVALAERLSRPRGKDTTTNWLRKTLSLSPIEIALLRESAARDLALEPARLAAHVKSARLAVTGLVPIDRAISTAGGIATSDFDEAFMLRLKPGVFVAGEMLDWEAPTGGYLLQATLATARAAALGVLRHLATGPDAISIRSDSSA